jgi:hypothetical protein
LKQCDKQKPHGAARQVAVFDISVPRRNYAIQEKRAKARSYSDFRAENRGTFPEFRRFATCRATRFSLDALAVLCSFTLCSKRGWRI